ncbi:zinc finger protein VAR3, chloroplastic [Solanum verrucosum]|uniref:zinc finger protein VAR3, chloroplastic n=1 Tax=Solanum verrucosum TaxID=315347 RepID=UPI0020D01645|nr:zinc finger protein VAR3, chloroplastic [Solanum verrucosum]
MSASRLFFLLGASTVRNCNKPANISSPFSPFRFTKPLLSPVVRFRSYNCISATIETNTIEPLVSPKNHPWPEWVAFVDRLKSKGYITEKSSSTGEDGDGSIYTDMNLLKDACLNFSRDRSDIFKKLSTQDMQKVVEKGCPNLFRKVVNSAKRLRIHLNLDEGEVCGACNFRGSCDRAYLILKESEGVARTVDIVRVLLVYAFDSAVISGGAMPPGSELIEVSARQLLSELVELSETPIDPDHPTPAPKASPRKKQSVDSRTDGLEDVEMKRRDLTGLEGEMSKRNVEMKQGDWVCPQCTFMNFARNAQCLRCKSKGPSRDAPVVKEMKKGDWNCPQCTFMNFASNTKCLRCQEQRPKRQLNPGEWECPSCDFLNFRSNMACKKCTCERPKDAKTQSKYEQQLWTKPY